MENPNGQQDGQKKNLRPRMRHLDLNYIHERIANAFFSDPEKLTGVAWKGNSHRKQAVEHILTDGHRSSDGNGTYITSRLPHMLCDGGDSKNNVSAIAYWQQSHGGTYLEAAKAVADIYGLVGLDLDDIDPDKGERWAQRKRNKARLLALTTTTTTTTSEEEAYLQGRGISLKTCAKWHLGAFHRPAAGSAPDAGFEAISTIIKDNTRYDTDKALQAMGVGTLYTIAIPITHGGRLAGITLTAPRQRIGAAAKEAAERGRKQPPKYKRIKFDDAPEGVVFALASPHKLGYAQPTLILTEGEFDCIAASEAMGDGYDVAATMHGSVGDDQACEIAKAGYQRVVLAADYEGDCKGKGVSEGERQRNLFVARSTEALLPFGVEVFVADLADAAHQENKQDANSYIQAFGAAAFKTRIKEAVPSSWFHYNQTLGQWQTALPDPDHVPPLAMGELRASLIYIIAAEPRYANRKELIGLIAPLCFGGDIAEADKAVKQAEQEVKNKRQNREEEAQRKRLIAAYDEAAQLASDGKVKEADAVLAKAKASTDERAAEDAEDFTSLMHCPTLAEMQERLQGRAIGIDSQYYFGQGLDREQLILPAGALTFVCAPSGHGKSLFLQNLALHLAAEHSEGAVLFYGLEEAFEATIARLINVHADMPLSRKPVNSILYWLKTRTADMMTEGTDTQAFEQRAGEVISLIESGRLRVHPQGKNRNNDAKTILRQIAYIAEHTKVKAVIIDHAQMLYLQGWKGDRKSEMKEVCRLLTNRSVAMGVPFVVAAQLNNYEALSPIEMPLQSISEASELGQCADIAITIWNSNTDARANSRFYRYSRDGNKSLGEDALKIANTYPQFSLGTAGKLYANLAKNRNGSRNLFAVFDIHPYSGRILTNEDASAPHQGTMFVEYKSAKPIHRQPWK